MAKSQKPTHDLQKLLMPVSGRELDELITEIVGQSDSQPIRDGNRPLEAPLFLQAAEARAAARGLTVERLLGDYSARLKESKYPTLDCLLPEDVQRVSEQAFLSDEQREHLLSCEPCRDLLAAAQLSPERRKTLIRELAASEGQAVSREDEIAAKQEEGTPDLQELVGASDVMRVLLQEVRRIASMDAAVLLEGETGTGKELVARAIHKLSTRRTRPLVTLNCAALTSTLLEDELFGHEKGAFTGAAARKHGLLERADGGTLFLDEIAEVPLTVQNRLLQVLQNGEFKPLGSDRPIHVNVRVIAATDRDLGRVVNAGSFREDLYYRISVARVHLPPLRDRLDDIPALVRHFVSKHQATLQTRVRNVSSEVIDQLTKHSWPGNVRELQNVVDRALLMSSGATLTVHDLPDVMHAPQRELGEDVIEVERRLILNALNAAKWKARGFGSAAESLGMTSEMLSARMNQLGIKKPSAKERTRG